MTSYDITVWRHDVIWCHGVTSWRHMMSPCDAMTSPGHKVKFSMYVMSGRRCFRQEYWQRGHDAGGRVKAPAFSFNRSLHYVTIVKDNCDSVLISKFIHSLRSFPQTTQKNELIVLSFPRNSSKLVFPSSMVINLWECILTATGQSVQWVLLVLSSGTCKVQLEIPMQVHKLYGTKIIKVEWWICTQNSRSFILVRREERTRISNYRMIETSLFPTIHLFHLESLQHFFTKCWHISPLSRHQGLYFITSLSGKGSVNRPD